MQWNGGRVSQSAPLLSFQVGETLRGTHPVRRGPSTGPRCRKADAHWLIPSSFWLARASTLMGSPRKEI